MKITCDIIRDLLPLYAEDMVSEDSKHLVDDHLCGCDECTKELAALKKPQRVPADVDVSSLKRLENTIRRRKVLTVAAAIMTLIALVVTGMTYLFTPYILTAEEAIEGVELREDGGLAIDYARGVNGKAGRGIFDVNNYGILCHTNRYDWYLGRKQDAQLEGMSQEELEDYIAKKYDQEECTQRDWDRFFDIDVDYGTFETKDGEHLYQYDPETWTEENGRLLSHPADRNHWYLDPATGDVEMLLWDGGQNAPTSIIWTPSSVHGYVVFGSLIVAVLFYVISRGVSGFWKEFLSRVVIVLGGIAVSTLMVTNGQLTTVEYYLTYEWNQAIYTEALVLSLTALLWHQLHRLNKQDKGL